MGHSAYLPEADELKRLLQHAMGAPQRPKRPPSDAAPPLFEPVPFALSRAPAVTTQLPPTQKGMAHLPSEATFQTLARGLAQAASIDERFSIFAAWLRQESGAQSVFIVDAEGLPMTMDGSSEDQRALAGSLTEPFRFVQQLVPSVVQSSARLTMASGEILELVWTETPLGRFGVGLISTTALAPAWSMKIPDLLMRAVDGRTRPAQFGDLR